MTLEQVRSVINSFRGERENLIPILQKTQQKLGYLPEWALSEIAHFLGISKSEVYGVVTFYAQFKLSPVGRHIIKVCLGTACHVGGGVQILETAERELGVRCGYTTSDGNFSLERVACVGSCALSPIMIVDDFVYGRLNQVKVREVLQKYMNSDKGEKGRLGDRHV